MNPTIDAILNEVHALFSCRTDEVNRYFEFLTALTESKADAIGTKQFDGSFKQFEHFSITRELIKTLRANGFLILYNLVESTMTNAIDAIHQIFQKSDLSFSDLHQRIQSIVLKNFRNFSSNENLNTVILHPIQKAILEAGYIKMNLFSGNVDAKRIRETAKDYGFEIAQHDTEASKDGNRLLNVKTKRNDLAHGKVSFEDCGHETSHDELISISKETIVYLTAVLKGIEDYIRNESYLAEKQLRSAS